jgi:hypothetical protein
MTYLLGSMLFMFAAIAVLHAMNGRPLPKHWSEDPIFLMFTVVAVIVCGGVVIFGLPYFQRAVVTHSHLRASTLFGRRANVPWSSVESVNAFLYAGVPMLAVRSNAVRAGLYVYILG